MNRLNTDDLSAKNHYFKSQLIPSCQTNEKMV